MQQPTIDQAQPTFPMLTDFHAGYRDGIQAFQEGIFFPEHAKVWSEDDIIQLVETELSGTLYRQQKRYEAITGRPTLSYLHHLGFIVGYLHVALDTK